jgi:hypothetical protein
MLTTDGRVRADRLGVHHAAATVVVEGAGRVTPATARLIPIVGRLEQAPPEIDVIGGHADRRPYNAVKVHDGQLRTGTDRRASVR